MRRFACSQDTHAAAGGLFSRGGRDRSFHAWIHRGCKSSEPARRDRCHPSHVRRRSPFLDQGSIGGASYCGAGCARTGDRRNGRRRGCRIELGLDSCREPRARIGIVMREHRRSPARLGRTQRARLCQRPYCGRMARCRGPCDGSSPGTSARDGGANRCPSSWSGCTAGWR